MELKKLPRILPKNALKALPMASTSGKFRALYNNVFSVFALPSWVSLGIVTVPQNFTGNKSVTEYIRVSVVSGGAAVNRFSTSGVLIIDIFTQAGIGPNRIAEIADKLDEFLVGKSYQLSVGVTQFMDTSTLTLNRGSQGAAAVLRDNAALCSASYEVPFGHFNSI